MSVCLRDILLFLSMCVLFLYIFIFFNIFSIHFIIGFFYVVAVVVVLKHFPIIWEIATTATKGTITKLMAKIYNKKNWKKLTFEFTTNIK